MIIIMLGAPGTGKGTVAGKLQDKLGFTQVSTGDIFRKNIKEGNEKGNLDVRLFSKKYLVTEIVKIYYIYDRLN